MNLILTSSAVRKVWGSGGLNILSTFSFKNPAEVVIKTCLAKKLCPSLVTTKALESLSRSYST